MGSAEYLWELLEQWQNIQLALPMSLELVDQCVKRLSQSLSQTERLLALYDSKELEGLIYEMAKCENNYVQIHDSTKKVLDQYTESLKRFAEVNARLDSKQPVDLFKSQDVATVKKTLSMKETTSDPNKL